MTERKLTIEIVVDQDKTDWHWIYDVMKGSPAHGIVNVYSIANEHTSSQVSDALVCAFNNGLLDKEDEL